MKKGRIAAVAVLLLLLAAGCVNAKMDLSHFG